VETLGTASERRRAKELAVEIDPVCGMTVEPSTAAASFVHEGKTYYFCNQGCLTKFRANPDKYLKTTDAAPVHHEVSRSQPNACSACEIAVVPVAPAPLGAALNPPKNNERDDVTGEPLLQREDDREDVVRRRLTLYETHAVSLRRYYAEMSDNRPSHLRIDGTEEPREVSDRVIRALAVL
jgi:YHS domain-containing protein